MNRESIIYCTEFDKEFYKDIYASSEWRKMKNESGYFKLPSKSFMIQTPKLRMKPARTDYLNLQHSHKSTLDSLYPYNVLPLNIKKVWKTTYFILKKKEFPKEIRRIVLNKIVENDLKDAKIQAEKFRLFCWNDEQDVMVAWTNFCRWIDTVNLGDVNYDMKRRKNLQYFRLPFVPNFDDNSDDLSALMLAMDQHYKHGIELSIPTNSHPHVRGFDVFNVSKNL